VTANAHAAGAPGFTHGLDMSAESFADIAAPKVIMVGAVIPKLW
jgi:hypothetical protein